MREKIEILFFLKVLLVGIIGITTTGYSQCFGDFARPFSGTITPVCDGSEEILFSDLGASHYLRVDLIEGTNYTINSTVSTDYLTISTDANNALIWGNPPLTFTPPSSGVYRIHVVLNSSCQQGWGSRDISAQCGGSGRMDTDCNDIFNEDFGSSFSSTYLYTNWCNASSYSNSSSGACEGFSWYAYGSNRLATTKTIDIPATGTTNLYFDYKFNQFVSYPVVSISNGGCNGSFTNLLTLAYNFNCYTETIDLSSYAGQSVNIRFYTYHSSGTFILDNVRVENCTSGGGGGGNILYEEDFSTSSPAVTSSGWSRNNGSNLACVLEDHAYYSTWSTNFFATNSFRVPRGKGVNITFDMKRYIGSATLKMYARVGGYGTFNTSSRNRSGWMELNTSHLTYPASCNSFTVTVPAEICGGQDLSIAFVASSSNLSIDNIVITDNSAKSSVPDISVAPLTYDLDASGSFWGPVNFSNFNTAATENKFSYRTYYGCNNSSGAYAYITSVGGNGGQVNIASVPNNRHLAFINTSNGDCTGAPDGSASIITREFNTSGCSGSTATLRFAFKANYSGGFTSDENYTSFTPRVFYAVTSDGPETGLVWEELNVNYYFPNGLWWYATTALPKEENLVVAFAPRFGRVDDFRIDDIKILCSDCSINSETGGAISCTSHPGLTEYVPNTEYTFTIGFTNHATHYKWIVRDRTSHEIYYGTTAGTNPAVVSGQGTQTATINFGTTGGTDYRVMCIPYDSDYGTDAAPTDACYAKLSIYQTLTEAEDIITPVELISFIYHCFDGKHILHWQTATEINNHYFIIQESNNAVDFYDIGKVYGAGNSSTQNYYDFQVNNNGEKYYRLKQVDYDGTYDYSKIITANCESNYGDISVFPNPFNGETFSIKSDYAIDNTEVIIIDISGRVLFTKKLDVKRGVTQLKLNKKHEPGTYLFIIKSDKQGIIFINKLFII